MKRETLTCPKLYSLAGHLQITKAQAIGHLALLWDFTAVQATAGDIGKWDNQAIAVGCDWQGDPDAFLRGLLKSGWIEDCEVNRLVVHDWGDHCENWVRAKAQKMGVSLLRRGIKNASQVPLLSTALKSEENDTSDILLSATLLARGGTKPNQTKPNQRVRAASEPDSFLAFYSSYPNKTDRKDALAVWIKLNPDESEVNVILAGLETAKKSERWGNPKYVMSPAKFLRGEHWNDQWPRANGAGASELAVEPEEREFRGIIDHPDIGGEKYLAWLKREARGPFAKTEAET